MRVVHKYHLTGERGELSLPRGAVPLRFALDPNGDECLWAEVLTQNPKVQIPYVIVGTGHELPPNIHPFVWTYVDTYENEEFVWHLFMGH